MSLLLKMAALALVTPALTLGFSYSRFGADFLTGPSVSLTGLASDLALLWAGSLPLALAIVLLSRRSPLLAVAGGTVLFAFATLATVAGGMLGPIGIFAYATMASLPAWAALWLLSRRKSPGWGAAGKPAAKKPAAKKPVTKKPATAKR